MNPREIALAIIDRVDRRKAYADVLLNARLDQAALPHADAALLTRTVYGTLRWRGRIDWGARPSAAEPLKDLDPLVRNLLRLGGYELLFLDRVPSYATVNELVELAKRRAGPGKARLVNAVLRQIARRERDAWSPPKASGNPVELAALVSHPPWLIDMWREQFGPEDSRRLMEANNEEAPLVLRANRRRITRDALVQRLCARGIDARPGRGRRWRCVCAERHRRRSWRSSARGCARCRENPPRRWASWPTPGPECGCWTSAPPLAERRRTWRS